jgi:Zn-dependent peptidase ImmA (M78 family)/transcriptional regulator with XRE-family HTH domain
MPTHRPTINPALLVWGRRSLNLTDEQAAKRLGVSVETLRAWEAGEQPPTIAQLRMAAEKYRRPLGVFFLPTPPADPTPPHDFRTVSGKDAQELSPELLVELRRAHHRRDVALELLAELERRAPRLQLRVQLDDDPEQAGKRVRQVLGVQLAQQQKWREGTAFNEWKAIIEARGVLVFQARGVSYKEVRGFSIAEHPLPVIVVNGSDFPNAKTFTLLHEFVHLLLHLGGICDPYAYVVRGRSRNSRIEVFCNHVAGAILVPASSLVNHASVVANEDPEGWTEAALDRIARDFGVSTLVVVRRLLTLGRTTERFYKEYHERAIARAEKHRLERPPQESGPPRPVMVVADLGRAFTGTVLDAYRGRVITASDVSEYLRVRVRQISDVQARLSLGPGE